MSEFWRILLTILGIAIAIDGFGSILLQEKQPWYWQLERLARSAAGILILLVALLVMS